MLSIRRSSERGHAQHGWLDSHHTFSFGGYYDPSHMGFGALRVINQDRVEAARGFPTHGHRNMEIISYVVEGALEHRDSQGNGGTLRRGDVQVMSAGRGIQHSEMNASQTDSVRFLQIWIEPDELETQPGYAERHFAPHQGLTLLCSPQGRDGSLRIRQDADVYRALLSAGTQVAHPLNRKRCWVQLVRGSMEVNDARVEAGDGIALQDVDTLELSAHDDVEALIFDLK